MEHCHPCFGVRLTFVVAARSRCKDEIPEVQRRGLLNDQGTIVEDITTSTMPASDAGHSQGGVAITLVAAFAALLHADLVFATHATTVLSCSLFLVIDSQKLDYFLNDRSPDVDATSCAELEHADAAGSLPGSGDFAFSYSFAPELLHLRHGFPAFVRNWVLR